MQTGRLREKDENCRQRRKNGLLRILTLCPWICSLSFIYLASKPLQNAHPGPGCTWVLGLQGGGHGPGPENSAFLRRTLLSCEPSVTWAGRGPGPGGPCMQGLLREEKASEKGEEQLRGVGDSRWTRRPQPGPGQD